MSWNNDYQVWLKESQSLQNAQLVANRLIDLGWTKESISATLGNMRHESSVNPNMYEYGFDWNEDRGFGLVQWTPRSKYWNWALQNGYSENELRNGEAQLDRIEYEAKQNIQWIETPNYPETFAQFRNSTKSIDYLTRAFTWNYERPRLDAGEESMPDRIAFANRCLNELDFSGGGGSGNTIPDGHQLAEMPIDYINITQGEYGEFHSIGTHSPGTGQELAMDFIFPMVEYPLFAPFDIEMMYQNPDYATNVWKNTKPVVAVDGTVYEQLHIIVIHDNYWNTYDVGMTRKQGEYFANSGNATGSYGISTGDHLHFEVMKGHQYQFPPSSSNQLHIYDIFDTSNVTDWVQGRGYPWKEFKGESTPSDPTDPDPKPDPDPEIPTIDFSKLFEDLDNKLNDMLTVDVYKQGNSEMYKNSFLQLKKQMDNTYKVKPNLKLFEETKKVIDDFLDNIRNLLP